MKKLFALLLILALTATAGWATTFTTPTIDGIITGDGSDWDLYEDFATMTFDGADYTLWITWDETVGMYIGIDRDENPNNKFLGDGYDEVLSLYVAIDTDQIPGSGALNDGYMTVNFSPYSAHLPEYGFYFAGSAGWYNWSVWNGSGWDWPGWRNDGTYYGWSGDAYIDDEVTILWSDIGNPEGVAVYVWLTYDYNDQPSPPWPPAVLAAWPEENPTGPFPTFPWAYEFYYNHYYCSPGVPAPCYMPACNIRPNLTDHSVPVALSSFTATGQAGAIEINWTTQSEVNALAYHVERSETTDGRYDRIATLEARGNAETAMDYRYVDQDVEPGQTYYYMLVDEDVQGTKTYHGPVFASAGAEVPGNYALMPNYPNPFNPSTAICYQTPRAGQVTLTVYNVLGQQIRTLVDARQAAGTYTVMWDGKDASGQLLNSGVYFYSIKAGNFTDTRKMVLMR